MLNTSIRLSHAATFIQLTRFGAWLGADTFRPGKSIKCQAECRISLFSSTCGYLHVLKAEVDYCISDSMTGGAKPNILHMI